MYRALSDQTPERTLRTDDAGRAEAPLEAGAHLVALTADRRCGVLDVDAGEAELRICAYGPVSLRGRVVDVDTGEAIPGAQVTARWLDVPDGALQQLGLIQARERSVEADPTGAFDLAPFRPGRYLLEVSADGFGTYLDERPWLPRKDWDMGTVPLEALGDLAIRLLGFNPAWPPSVSYGLDGQRVTVDAEGRATLPVPLRGEPQHFSVWLHDQTMLNVYQRGTLDEVREVTLRVGGARTLRVVVEGEAGAEVAALGKPSLRVRYSPAHGLHADWNRDLDAGEPHEADCIDGEVASVDLVALVDHWPNVLCSKRTAVAATGVTEVELRFPSSARALTILGSDGAPIAQDTFVELRRAHDSTRWLASGYTDNQGRVFWPEVDAPELYCGGAFDTGPPESFFIDLRLPNAAGTAPLAPLALGPPSPHRARVVVPGETEPAPLAGARVRVLGRHTDQLWTFYDTDAEGWTPPFLATEGSAVDLVVDDPRVHTERVPLGGAETVIEARVR